MPAVGQGDPICIVHGLGGLGGRTGTGYIYRGGFITVIGKGGKGHVYIGRIGSGKIYYPHSENDRHFVTWGEYRGYGHALQQNYWRKSGKKENHDATICFK